VYVHFKFLFLKVINKRILGEFTFTLDHQLLENWIKIILIDRFSIEGYFFKIWGLILHIWNYRLGIHLSTCSIFSVEFYISYKGSKLELTSKWKPALTRPGSDAPPLSTGFIAKVQFIVEIIPRRTHARRLTITFFYPSDHELSLRPTVLVFAECILVMFTLLRSRIREAWCYRHRAWHRSARRTKRTVERDDGEKKCWYAKEGNGTHTERGINCTSDADLFEHDTLPWYVMRLGVNRRAWRYF